MFPRYLQYLLTDFRQTFVTGASWDRDELIRFWGQKVKGHGMTECIPDFHVSTISPVSIDRFSPNFVTGASWDTDDLITFLGRKVKGQGHTAEAHSTRRYRRVQLFLVVFVVLLVIQRTTSLRSELASSHIPTFCIFTTLRFIFRTFYLDFLRKHYKNILCACVCACMITVLLTLVIQLPRVWGPSWPGVTPGEEAGYTTRKPSYRWQTRATLAKSLHGLRKSSGVVSCRPYS